MYSFQSKLALFLLLTPFSLKAQLPGDNFFGQTLVHEIRINFPQTYWWDSLVATHTGDYYIAADIQIDGNMVYGIGAKFKGNSSYNNPSVKKSFKLDFNRFIQGQNYDGLKKLNLNNGFKDPTFVREKTALDFLIAHNVPAPRCAYANVYLNDTLWGLYMVVEEIDDEFLERWFGEKRGNLFKGDPSGDMRWYGASPSSYYSQYELHSNETQNDWTDLVTLINIVNNAPIANLHSDLDTFFNTDRYAYYWAATNLFANLDSYMGSGHNYYMYHDSTNNRFEFIAWDVNESYGVFSMGMSVTQLQQLAVTYIPAPAGNRPLHNRMLQNTTLKQKLYDAVCDEVNLEFSIWNLEWYLDSLANLVRPSVYADPNKFYTNQNFEDNFTLDVTAGGPGGVFPGLKPFLTNRRNYLAADLAANGCTVGTDNLMATPFVIEIFPNPCSDKLNLSGSTNEWYTFEITSLTGQRVQTGTFYGSTEINLYGIITPGAYLITVKNNTFENQVTYKLLKQ